MTKKPTLADVLLRLEQERPPLLDLVPMIMKLLGTTQSSSKRSPLGTTAPAELMDTLPKDPRDVH
jgi:hypothetical protein